jgi:hypothetical protein
MVTTVDEGEGVAEGVAEELAEGDGVANNVGD